MKFTIVVVVLALATAGVQSGGIALPAFSPYSYTAVGGPSFYAAPAVFSAPAYYAAPTYLAAAEGSYIAKTRGAIHTAPLPGHFNSVANINEEPAPGTF